MHLKPDDKRTGYFYPNQSRRLKIQAEMLKRLINEFGFVSNVLWVRDFIPPTPICVTLTDAVATSYFLFLIFYVSGNSLQLLSNAVP